MTNTNDSLQENNIGTIITSVPENIVQEFSEKQIKSKYRKYYIVFGILLFLFLVRIPLGLAIQFTSVFGIPIPTAFLQLIDTLALLWIQLLFVIVIIAVYFIFFRNEKSLALGLSILTIFVFMALFADYLSPYSPISRNSNCIVANCAKSPPSPQHIMGTTTLGFDVYSRIIYGAQIPLQIAIITVAICFTFGVPFGIISGYYGGMFDRLINAIMDILYSFPALLLAITLSVFLVSVPFIGGNNDLRITLVVAFSNGLVYIPILYRITRGKVLQVKQQPYIEAVRSIGASNPLIMLRYILSNVISAPITMIPFAMTDAILTEAALAFLGIGIQYPTPDWGYDLNAAKTLTQTQPWLIFFPGLMIFFLAFAFSLIGDSLNDKFNPQINQDA